jgi:hypothetical protein
VNKTLLLNAVRVVKTSIEVINPPTLMPTFFDGSQRKNPPLINYPQKEQHHHDIITIACVVVADFNSIESLVEPSNLASWEIRARESVLVDSHHIPYSYEEQKAVTKSPPRTPRGEDQNEAWAGTCEGN